MTSLAEREDYEESSQVERDEIEAEELYPQPCSPIYIPASPPGTGVRCPRVLIYSILLATVQMMRGLHHHCTIMTKS